MLCLSFQGLIAVMVLDLCIFQAADHQPVNVFSAQTESHSTVGQDSPCIPLNVSHCTLLPGSTNITLSIRQPVDLCIRSLSKHESMTQPWAENLKMKALCFLPKLKLLIDRLICKRITFPVIHSLSLLQHRNPLSLPAVASRYISTSQQGWMEIQIEF